MEKTRYMIAMAVVAMTAAVSHGVAATGENQGSNWFVGADAGVSLQQDVKEKMSGTKIGFDPGVRFDFMGGYRFTDQWSVSLEAGYGFNSVKSIGGMSLSGTGGDIDLHQVPILANGLYTFPLKCRVKPFIGGGVGGVFSVVEFSGSAAGLAPSGDSQGAAAFGYQGIAGVRYEINDRMELGVIYKFLGTTDNKFDDFKLEGTKTHTIGLSFIYKF